jgi:hypothetical protein
MGRFADHEKYEIAANSVAWMKESTTGGVLEAVAGGRHLRNRVAEGWREASRGRSKKTQQRARATSTAEGSGAEATMTVVEPSLKARAAERAGWGREWKREGGEVLEEEGDQSGSHSATV